MKCVRIAACPPVAWGDQPWLPVAWAPTDFPDRTDYAPNTGRAKDRAGDRSSRDAAPTRDWSLGSIAFNPEPTARTNPDRGWDAVVMPATQTNAEP